MTNIKVKVNGSSITAEANGKLTSGMVGVPVAIEYNEEWNGLIKTAIFRVGNFSRDRRNVEDSTTVPWEVMRHGGKILEVGIEGRDADDKIIMPTIWATASMIFNGANATIPGAPTPDSEAGGGGGGSSGCGGAEVLNVWVEGTETDHTSREIFDHVSNVRGPVQLQYNDMYYQLLYANDIVAWFGYIDDEGYATVVCVNGNEIEEYHFDYVPASHFDEVIGDISTALDSIIAIQEELIGT